MDQRYLGRSAIVTGAGSGIGKAVAERIAAEGGRVACLDLVADSVEATAAAIGGGAIALACDVSDYAAVDAAVVAATAAFGQIDVLFNVAGIGGFDHTHEIDPARFEKIVAVNLTGTFNACRAVLPQMVERGTGAIVNTASTAGIMGQPWSAAYCASKGGVIQLTKALATEYDPPLCINAVAPGGVDTPLYTQFIPPDSADWNRLKKMSRDNVPPAAPEKLANAFAFLGSEEASYMTGSIVVVDGGITA
jgi:meso-butanediol dehydrogenase/(S,S)-butanediol dehydrogenase/diacetyl reductase